MEDMKTMKGNAPPESNSVPGFSSSTDEDEDQPNDVFEMNKDANGNMNSERQSLGVDGSILDHLRHDDPSPTENSSSVKVGKTGDNSGTGSPVNSSLLDDQDTFLQSTKSPEPIEPQRDDNSGVSKSIPVEPNEVLQPLVDVGAHSSAHSSSSNAPEEEMAPKNSSVAKEGDATELFGDSSDKTNSDNDARFTSHHPQVSDAESCNDLLPSDEDDHLVAKVSVPSEDDFYDPIAKVSNHLVSITSFGQPVAKVSEPSDDMDQPLPKDPNHLMPLEEADVDEPIAKVPSHFVPPDDTGRPLAKVSSFTDKSSTSAPSKYPENYDIDRVQIDTAMPIESVKQAVSKFGGIVDWKAHRVQTVERRKCIDQELEKLQEEIPLYKKQFEASEEGKMQVLKELDGTRRLIEELKLNLERAQTEEKQARQDSELAKLRVEEMEQGIADEASIATKAQLEVARARHHAAVSDLKAVTAELEQLRSDYAVLVAEKDATVREAEEAVSESKQVEKSVEDLTVELITVKQALDAAHAAHLEAEDHRIGAAMAREQDTIYWEKEVKEAEEEIERLNQQILSSKELKSELDTASAMLQDLKAGLAAYMETQVEQESLEAELLEPEKRTHCEIQAAVESANNELKEVNLQVEKAVAEVNFLKVASTSLKSELEKEKEELITNRQREEMALITISSIEAELNRTKSDIVLAQIREKEARDKMIELPKQLQRATQEADRAKSIAEAALQELSRAKEEADEAKTGATTLERRLLAAKREIEAAKAAEKLAIAAMNALEESEQARNNKGVDSPSGVTLSLEEYYELSKQAHAAEEEAKMRVAAAISQIEVAKEGELNSLKKLEDVNNKLAERRQVLENALQKADKAKEGKMAVEQEVRRRRESHEQRRKANESVSSVKSARSSFEERKESEGSVNGPAAEDTSRHNKSPKGQANESKPENPQAQETNTEPESSPEVTKPAKKKKRSFFPRIFMFLARKKSSKT
ncbi:PREDICTED: protein WEAK CHLOROPLAST MOVEMENT UNDER BLUE LIGHT 1-like [Ipomoea nil]|uniref:protein WEAK CHLOROPLAST MOVEMENT UNDER BLUE LIGHT 1-like n=1 Tax=Ipomoea nil TaxID=35883 RepID=UPI000901F4A9|nr:PREDICTED: protein WEAK CHLOROPLAST MOVEMENT UNDER BLUE LIGHT 1-like [Ipomoea nil]XP_019153346.1 PREDICTED: protein WEAK CHLOROPLAST MOVEMENT UNDER BLUE LIGHT 1-like [Ipomoea nil]